LLGGLGIALLTPPLKGADERDQFTRAYQISTGDVLTHHGGERYGALLPSGYLHQIEAIAAATYTARNHRAFLSYLSEPPPRGGDVFVQEGTIASYGPGGYVAYLPPLALGRVIGLSLIELLYLARFAGVVAYASLLALAVRRLPLHRWVMVSCGLIPETLNQASTVSADGMTTALSFVVVAEALRLSLDRDAATRRILVEATVAAVLLALAKPPYVLFVLLLLVPAWRHRERLLAPLVATVLAALALSVVWLRYQWRHSMSLDLLGSSFVGPELHRQYAYRDVDIAGQSHLVAAHPWAFAQVLWHTAQFQGLAFPEQLLGLLATYQIPAGLVALSALIVVGSCLTPDRPSRPTLPRVDRIALLGVSLLVALVVSAIVYTNANAFGAPRIDQLTPRYFLPVLPPLLIGVLPARWRRLGIPPIVVAGSVLALWVGVLVALQHFQFSIAPVLKDALVGQGRQVALW
jgi:uncharacterized membrane protein